MQLSSRGERMNEMQRKVREFHEVFDHPVRDVPQATSIDEWDLRAELIFEELKEYEDACAKGDVVEIADALGDLLYVVFGTAVAHGIDLEPVFREIHRSNMTKLDENGETVPHPTVPGKIGKSPRYTPPQLEEILEAQGYEG